MGLTQAQKTLITKSRSAGSSELGASLDDAICSYLLATIIRDLGLIEQFPEIPSLVPSFFETKNLRDLRLENLHFQTLAERLFEMVKDADTYFYCLATLHKARLKYERILQSQSLPTIDQVGPRGLLQFGMLSPRALVTLLLWRKWMFDIDNRAAQETGYVFEPVIAYAIGGVPYSASKSPIKRGGLGPQGRQVDCIVDRRAYEVKIRVTIAASGQGRWSEELVFPRDCQESGYMPVLVVLDPTPNPKLSELQRVFVSSGGVCYIGKDAWDHLAGVAGETMATFLDLYVHQPLQQLIAAVPQELPSLQLDIASDRIILDVDGERIVIDRASKTEIPATFDALPDDIDSH